MSPDHPFELAAVDKSIVILVGPADHPHYILLAQLDMQLMGNFFEVFSWDVSCFVFVKELEYHIDVLMGVSREETWGHEMKELREGYTPCTVSWEIAKNLIDSLITGLWTKFTEALFEFCI